MKKIIAAVAAAGLLCIGAAAPASAETLYRNGANKVTITAQGAPEGAAVTKAKVTVKKGKKTVARNKNFYRAKKGKYKVTSTVSYFIPAYSVQGPAKQVQGSPTQVQAPATTKNILPIDIWTGTCTTTGHSIAQDNSTYGYLGGELDYLAGEVYMDYTAHCPSAYYYDTNDDKQTVVVDVKWQEGEYILNETVTGDKVTDILNDVDVLYIGQFTDPTYEDFSLVNPVTETIPGMWTTVPGAWTTVPGDWTTVPATPVTTVKSTRTVVVK